MRLLEASRIAGVRLKEAQEVSAAYEVCRNRRRAALIRLVASGCTPNDLRAAERRLQAADMQLAQAKVYERSAWLEAGRP